MALAAALPAIDRRYELPAVTSDPETARQLLSTVATATVTFAGLVFSITILALQLTSNQFSPRVLRQFLRDRRSQFALGTFVGVFLYSLAVLSQISGGDDPFVPSLAVDTSILAGATAVSTFIMFVAHIAQSIRVVHIVEAVARETRVHRERTPSATGIGPGARGRAGRARARDEPGAAWTGSCAAGRRRSCAGGARPDP